MSGIGHFAAGFVAKPLAPKVSLWALLAASETNEILYFVFTSTGIEPKAIITTMNFSQGISYLAPVSNPWSHGLFMSVVWSLLAGGIAYLFYRDKRTAGLIGLVVFSHWLLDFLMHSNLPLFFGNSPLLGLGLENSGPGFIFITILDLVLLGSGVVVYWRTRWSSSVER
jgi:membrane-bound metal-dependent hydrolase YbcI (DUF457 family)